MEEEILAARSEKYKHNHTNTNKGESKKTGLPKSKFSNRQKGIFIFVYMLCYVLAEEILFSVGVDYGFNVYKLLFALAFGALIYFLGVLPKNHVVGWGIQVFCIIVVGTVYISQFVYVGIFATPYMVASLSGTGAAMEFFGVAVNMFLKKWYISAFYVAQIAVFFTIYRKAHKTWQKPRGICKKSLLLFVVMTVASIACPIAFARNINGAGYYMLYEHIPVSSAKQVGMLPSMILDVKFNVLGISSEPDFAAASSVSHIKMDNTQNSTSTQQPEISEAPAETEKEDRGNVVMEDYSPNELQIEFNMHETDEKLLAMNNYFSSKQPTMKNEYTGMFKGKNLILITAEGWSGFVIDKERTPALYRMKTQGFDFKNFYTPIWNVSTSDGEYVATTGLVPKSGVWSYTQIADNSMPMAFGNQFARENYKTMAFHDHSYTYYNRDKSYPTMGYEYLAPGHGLNNITNQWPESDVEMIDETVPMYIDSSPFHIYYMSVSGHLEYNWGGNMMAYKNKAVTENLPYCEAVNAYLACQMEFEYALEDLINRLDEAGQLENTVIAISGDHYPYGLENSEYAQLRGIENMDTTFELYENDFILWCADMEKPITVEKYCSSLDIAPTLSNLFGLNYDSRLYMGKDILSDSEGMVVFMDRSFITDKVMYDANRQTATSLTGEEITEEYLLACLAEVSNMFEYSAGIIDTDYYAYIGLEDAINSVKD